MMCTIHALASAVDARDHYTHDHAGRVSRLCIAAAKEMGVTDAALLRQVELAALLHDIGKIGIPDAILSKPAQVVLFPSPTKVNRYSPGHPDSVLTEPLGLRGVNSHQI